MSRRGCDALAYVSYYREIPEEDGQHAIYAWPMSADLPDHLAGKLAHGWGGIQGSTVTKSHPRILREDLLQGIGEP
jgi:truncated hemoglobin YjbI